MIILCGSTKGGVGKSTVAVQLAASLAAEGHKVWLVDGDKQTSSSTAMHVRADAGVEPFIAADAYDDGKVLASQVRNRYADFDHVVIDSGGRDSATLRAALSISHVLLLPFEPASFGVWAFDDISALVEQANEVRSEPLKAYAFLNKADPSPSSRDNLDAVASASDVTCWKVLDVGLISRKAYERASARGVSVIGGSDPKASTEMAALLAVIFERK